MLDDIAILDNPPQNLRIVTRADFDGIACAVLLRNVFGEKLPVVWERPENIQNGTADIQSGDIIANLPFDESALLWFDHHYTNKPNTFFRGRFEVAPSAAVVVYNHYLGHFTRNFTHLVAMADKIDAALLTLEEVAEPWNFDELFLAMTVSDRIKEDAPYWTHIVDLLDTLDVSHALKDPEITRRFSEVKALQIKQTELLRKVSVLNKNTIVCDFRQTNAFKYENRFMPYVLFPQGYASVKISHPGPNQDITAVNAGHSIFNPKCKVNMGVLLSRFGGGGHAAAAACRFNSKYAAEYVPKIIAAINKNEEIK